MNYKIPSNLIKSMHDEAAQFAKTLQPVFQQMNWTWINGTENPFGKISIRVPTCRRILDVTHQIIDYVAKRKLYLPWGENSNWISEKSGGIAAVIRLERTPTELWWSGSLEFVYSKNVYHYQRKKRGKG